MDFVHDQMLVGRPFRMLTVIDQWSREAALVEPRRGYSGVAVAEPLRQRLRDDPMPVSISVDHGTEFTSKALEKWAWETSVKLDFLHHWKSMENGHIKSFNG